MNIRKNLKKSVDFGQLGEIESGIVSMSTGTQLNIWGGGGATCPLNIGVLSHSVLEYHLGLLIMNSVINFHPLQFVPVRFCCFSRWQIELPFFKVLVIYSFVLSPILYNNTRDVEEWKHCSILYENKLEERVWFARSDQVIYLLYYEFC